MMKLGHINRLTHSLGEEGGVMRNNIQMHAQQWKETEGISVTLI